MRREDIALSRTPVPSEDEAVAVAIIAAIEAVWPRPAASAPEPEPPSRWRFSGRWWAKPVPVRRERP
jgi:hypothetical protein